MVDWRKKCDPNSLTIEKIEYRNSLFPEVSLYLFMIVLHSYIVLVFVVQVMSFLCLGFFSYEFPI